ncbi:MAG: NADH:ubiquinone reductase (Na(+)-transporting) subunit D [Planctomycetota bacterium]
MASKPPQIGGACGAGLCGGRGKQTLEQGLWGNNPISIQILGICSALAVTNRFENSLVMGGAVIFVTVLSNLMVSVLRTTTPRRIRMIAEVAIIATFVILFDQFLKAFYWDMSKQLGPYVGLIITNCIIMGRAEAFALQSRPLLSVVDGLGNGLGYTMVLGIIGFVRELLGTGRVLLVEKVSAGLVSLDVSGWYHSNQVMILAPGAFIALGFLIAVFNAISPPPADEEDPP